MASVFRAFDQGMQRTVALKLLDSQDARLIALFEREYETLAMLDHPRVIAVYEFGIVEAPEQHGQQGARYYTMELLAGGDLTTRVPLPWAEVCAVLRDVCTSLVLLHAQQLVHRDVNPRNVRIDQHGRAKLIDFGALTNFGPANELVGTPACMAPEALRGQLLDQRTDLFSLGAVAYWALTGKTPYALRALDEAEQAWRETPAAPSARVANIPKALDELVLSLLSVDPLGRPASAAEVIDRLSVIAQLDDEALAAIAESHIRSPALVGRAPEQTQLELLLARSLGGHGGVAVIDGGKGLGRSRLLSQLAIDARLNGFTILQVAGAAASEPGAALAALAASLLKAAPEQARAALPSYLPVLAPLLEEPQAAARAPESSNAVSEREHNVRLASALARWLLAVSVHRPLLIAVDDAQLLHPSCANVLTMIAGVAQEARLLLAVTRKSGAATPPAVEQLATMGSVITLEPIERPSVEQLALSIFGDAPHRVRVARWLAETGRGAPGEILERLRELMARGLIRYAGGAWVLPAELDAATLAAAFHRDADARLRQLGQTALTLAQILSLHRGRLSEALCFRVLPSSEPRAVLSALSQLVEAEILAFGSEGYRLAEGDWRALLLETLDAAAQRKLHLLLARTLLAASRDRFMGLLAGHAESSTTGEIVAAINVGLHFLRGGDQVQGEELLRKGSVELTVRGEGLMAAAPDLEAAIETYRNQGRPRHSYAVLMTVLTLAGTYTDWRLGYRYGEELLDLLAEAAGVKLAGRLERVLGRKLALYLGIGFGFLRFYLVPGRRVTASFRELLLGLMGIGSAVLGVCPVLQDAERAQRILKQLHPLSFFPAKHVVRIVHEFQIALAEYSAGRYREAVEKGHRVLAYVQSAAARAVMPPEARAQFEAGVHIMLGQMHVMRSDALAAQTVEDLSNLNTGTSRQTAVSILGAYHGHRGEREEFIKHTHEMDRLANEAGSTWRNDVMVPRMLWTTLALCEDVMGLKRAAQQLSPLAAQMPTVAVMRDLTHACYLSEHGLPDEALARYAHLFEAAIGAHDLRAAQHLGAYARILRKAGQPQRARQICEQLLAQLTPADHEFAVLTFGARLELPLSLLALGEHERAAELLDALLLEHQAHDNPLLHGLTHGARAEVALAMNDRPRVQRHLELMKNWLRDTRHPALYAQYQRLAERARKHSDGRDSLSTRSQPPASPALTAQAPSSPSEDTLRALLSRVVQEADASAGYLYRLGAEGTLELVCTLQDQLMPDACERELAVLLRGHGNDAFETELLEPHDAPELPRSELMTLVEDTAGIPLRTPWPGRHGYWFALNAAATSTVPAGALVLVEGGAPLKRSRKLLLEQLAAKIAPDAQRTA